MRRRRVLKSLLVGSSVLLGGCSSNPDLETTRPDETETPDFPEVGTVYFEEVEPEEDSKKPVWDLVLELDEDYTEGTLSVFDIDERANYENSLIDRINLERIETVLRTPYIREDSGRLEVQLPRNGYRFTIEVDDEVVAESRFQINRDISADGVQFESYVGGSTTDGIDAQVLEFGKTSFSVQIENTGNAPIVVDNVVARGMPLGNIYGFWLNGELQYRAGDYIEDILSPGDSKRYGAVGYTLPELRDVDEVCDGSERTTILAIESDVRAGFDSWRYEVKYTLNEPASKTRIRGASDGQARYTCESGEIRRFGEIDSN